MELIINLDKSKEDPLYVQLYSHIKKEIINKRIKRDEKLPSVRRLSKYLNISKTTVENAYQQLLAEGYIYSKPQKGYFANYIESDFIKNDDKFEDIYDYVEDYNHHYKYDYKSEYVEEENFDFNTWKKHINYVINYNKEQLYTYGNVQGERVLREEILRYVYRTRGVICSSNNIIIGAGVQPLLNVLSLVMKKDKIQDFAIEDPGFNRAKDIFINNGFNIKPIKVTQKGIDIERLLKEDVRLCYVSPSHQFPTGTVMPVNMRSKLIKWAKEKDGYIIEDDYNSELRYEGKPIPAMQSLDKSRVIYLGSFSTVLVPSIRISFIIVPDKIMNLYSDDLKKHTQTSSKIEQLALARMMKEGDFERHIRKIRKNYAKKNEYTLKTIRKYMGDKVEVISKNSGLYILIKIKNNKLSEEEFINIAKEKEIALSSIWEHSIIKYVDYKGIFLLSFRGIKTKEIDDSIKLLSNLIVKS